MDIKTKLEDEILINEIGSKTINALNKKEIFTIEDFINFDFSILKNSSRREFYAVYQEILRNKYLNEPLVIGILLDEYCFGDYDDNKKLNRLGLNCTFYVSECIKKIISEKGECKIIDLIKNNFFAKRVALRLFYLEYYENNNKLIDVTTETLESLKKELIQLNNKSEVLSTEISLLENKIAQLESKGVSNGKR